MNSREPNAGAAVARRTVLRTTLAGITSAALLRQEQVVSLAQTAEYGESTGISIDVLGSVDLPTSELTESGYWVIFVYIIMPPESSHTWEMPNKEVLIGYTAEGMVQYQVTGRTELRHLDGHVEMFDTGDVIDSVSGDFVCEYDFTENKSNANPSQGDAIWLTVELDRDPGDVSEPVEYEGGQLLFPWIAALTSADWRDSELSGMPVRLTMRKITFDPGGVMTFHDLHPVLRLITEGGLEMTITSMSGTPNPPRRVMGGLYGFWKTPEASVRLSNLYDEPVALYELMASAIDSDGTTHPSTPTA